MLLNTRIYPSSLPKLCLLVIVLTLSSSPATSQTCKNACGSIPIKYPFGTGPGCGDPRFHTRVTCTNQQQLTFATHTGCYPITAIDYATQVLHLTDPSMSTCACTQPSNGFGLDPDAPFSFHDDTVFALLDCSSNATVSPAASCDSWTGTRVCGLLDSCRAGAASRVEVPESACCAYVPVDLGPAFEMDLRRLKCGGYSGMYGFGGHDDDPGSWRYGIGIKYKFNFNNEYPPTCGKCEKSKGVCGYNVGDDSLLCNCPSGFNSTEDCSFEATWNRSSRFLPWQTGALWMYGLAWVLLWMLV